MYSTFGTNFTTTSSLDDYSDLNTTLDELDRFIQTEFYGLKPREDLPLKSQCFEYTPRFKTDWGLDEMAPIEPVKKQCVVISPKFWHVDSRSKFFVIKSFNEEDVKLAFNHKVWCSTLLGNMRLSKAYKQAVKNHSDVYLMFSVNASGKFCGVARMKSDIGSAKDDIWSMKGKFNGSFDIEWVYVKDVNNGHLRHLLLKNNENKPVTNSRDTQEINIDIGLQMMDIFKTYKSKTSFL